MTRDHIIPKSLGGKDVVGNLRPGCTLCNEARSNDVTPEDIRFAQGHPELVDDKRITRGLASLQAHLKRLEQNSKNNKEEIARVQKPFKDMGYL